MSDRPVPLPAWALPTRDVHDNDLRLPPGVGTPSRVLVDGTVELPWRSGDYQPGAPVDPRHVRPLLARGVTPLDDLYRDGYTLYHPGVLPLIGYDPVAAYWAESGLDTKDAPLRVDLPHEWFVGAPGVYARAVFACPPGLVGGLLAFLDRMALQEVAGAVGRADAVHQILAVSDPFPPPGAVSPTVPVHVYGLESAREALLWTRTFGPNRRTRLTLGRHLPRLTPGRPR